MGASASVFQIGHFTHSLVLTGFPPVTASTVVSPVPALPKTGRWRVSMAPAVPAEALTMNPLLVKSFFFMTETPVDRLCQLNGFGRRHEAALPEVENTGLTPGEKVVHLYVTDVEASVPVPIRSLQGLKRVFLDPGERQSVSFTLTPQQLSVIDGERQCVVEPGVFEISVGGKQPGFSGVADASTTGYVTGRFEVTG
jgi:hypothetical protein